MVTLLVMASIQGTHNRKGLDFFLGLGGFRRGVSPPICRLVEHLLFGNDHPLADWHIPKSFMACCFDGPGI
jgi:hypothetical protein